jgi:UDPglucose 6-dehydrogenase
LASRVMVVGSGYVGTVVAACLAHLGHSVIGVEVDQQRIAQLRCGIPPCDEPGLDALVRESLETGKLRFSQDLAFGMRHSDIVFICVGTPPGTDGRPDMSAMATVAAGIAANLHHYHVIVTKSTVPIGTGRWLASVIEDRVATTNGSPRLFSVVSNPEFLREGNAVADFLHPDRIVLGSDDPEARELVAEVYRPIIDQRIPGEDESRPAVPLLQTALATGEMTKYASNAFLATKISFANEMARLCDLVGADITEVTAAVGLDARIGTRFLEAGLGWGGSCFGKDLSALVSTAIEYGYQPRLLEATMAVNEGQRRLVVDELRRHLRTLPGARVGILGLTFKPGTNDVRDSPGIDIARRLINCGVFVQAYDPKVDELLEDPGIRLLPDPYDAALNADALVIATEWPEFLTLDLMQLRKVMRGDLIFDGRKVFNAKKAQHAGFRYLGIGRPVDATGSAARAILMPTPSLDEHTASQVATWRAEDSAAEAAAG